MCFEAEVFLEALGGDIFCSGEVGDFDELGFDFDLLGVLWGLEF